ALARVPAQALRAGEVLEVARFLLADEFYAIETRHVTKVVRLIDITPVPGAPDFLVGVINLRGEILAVVDLRKFFDITVQASTDLSRVIVLGDDRDEFGVLADAVHEVVTLRTNEVLEPPGSVMGIERQYLRGVTKDALIVLDGAALLRDSRIFIDQGDDSGA